MLNSASRILQCWSCYGKNNSARHQHDTERTQNRAGLEPLTAVFALQLSTRKCSLCSHGTLKVLKRSSIQAKLATFWEFTFDLHGLRTLISAYNQPPAPSIESTVSKKRKTYIHTLRNDKFQNGEQKRTFPSLCFLRLLQNVAIDICNFARLLLGWRNFNEPIGVT